jgi:glutathione S-transferase
MSLTLYYHPLSSFCMKALIALYESNVEFTPHLVDLGNPEAADAFRKLWPPGTFPVLRDASRGDLVPESTIIIEYLAQKFPDTCHLLPADAEAARQARFWDRFYDLNVHVPMQKIVGDKLRPADSKDPFGVAQARKTLATSYGMIDAHMAYLANETGAPWATGGNYTMADCAASPALHYANLVAPLDAHSNTAAYLARLKQRPSFARVLKEAEPYFAMFPG